MSSAVEDVAVDSVVPARVSQGIGRGRPLILAVADVGALASAYALTYVAANAIAPPAVDAPGRLLALLAISAVPIWLAIFTAYDLYDRDTKRIPFEPGRGAARLPRAACRVVAFWLVTGPLGGIDFGLGAIVSYGRFVCGRALDAAACTLAVSRLLRRHVRGMALPAPVQMRHRSSERQSSGPDRGRASRSGQQPRCASDTRRAAVADTENRRHHGMPSATAGW